MNEQKRLTRTEAFAEAHRLVTTHDLHTLTGILAEYIFREFGEEESE